MARKNIKSKVGNRNVIFLNSIFFCATTDSSSGVTVISQKGRCYPNLCDQFIEFPTNIHFLDKVNKSYIINSFHRQYRII